MPSPRDYLSDLRGYYLPVARVRVRDAWYRAAGRHIQGTRARFSNWRNLRDIQRGRRDAPARLGDQVRSRTPVVRGRVNRATGRAHRDDIRMGQASDRTLARLARGSAACVRLRPAAASPAPVQGDPDEHYRQG